VLEAGAVVSIEPGVYFPEWGGIRIEDVVVIEEKRVRVLTRSGKEPWLAE
jgi:Xaa-Pro aminopeptidase